MTATGAAADLGTVTRVTVEDFLYREAALLDACRKAHREYPHSRTNHQIHNVVLGVVIDGPEGEAQLPVSASFTVWRFRNGKTSYYVGRHYYRLIGWAGSLRILTKRSVLDMTELRPAGDLAIIL